VLQLQRLQPLRQQHASDLQQLLHLPCLLMLLLLVVLCAARGCLCGCACSCTPTAACDAHRLQQHSGRCARVAVRCHLRQQLQQLLQRCRSRNKRRGVLLLLLSQLLGKLGAPGLASMVLAPRILLLLLRRVPPLLGQLWVQHWLWQQQ
jgi:hypothetical protein